VDVAELMQKMHELERQNERLQNKVFIEDINSFIFFYFLFFPSFLSQIHINMLEKQRENTIRNPYSHVQSKIGQSQTRKKTSIQSYAMSTKVLEQQNNMTNYK